MSIRSTNIPPRGTRFTWSWPQSLWNAVNRMTNANQSRWNKWKSSN